MKPYVKIFLALLAFSIGNGLQNLAVASSYKTAEPGLNNAAQQQQQDSSTKPGNNPPLHKAYPPANPGQPHPDRVNPGNNNNQRALPTDTGHSRQSPPRRKAKLTGEQSNPQ